MTSKDIVRCINPATNQVRGFPRWMCDGNTDDSKSWQVATGFRPQEIKQEVVAIPPSITTESTAAVSTETETPLPATPLVKQPNESKTKRKYTKRT